jgi:dienelactone hydrolase
VATDADAREAPPRDAPPTPRDAAAASVRVGEPALLDGVVHWLATPPDGSGDMALYAEGPGAPRRLTAPGTSLRSRLYGYGAGSWCATPVGAVGVEARSQSLVRLDADELVESWAPTGANALGDVARVPETSTVVLVVDGPGAHRELAVVDLVDGKRTTLLVDDGFVAEPQPSPDGAALAWLRWPAGSMPWDAAELWVGALDAGEAPALRRVRRVDGGPGVSAGQPTWRPDGSLAFVTEAAGWWQPWCCDDGGVVRRLCARRAEFQRPRWLTCRWLAPLGADGALACAFADGDGEHVGVLEPNGALSVLDQPCVRVDGLAAGDARLAWVGATTGAQGVVLAADATGQVTPITVAMGAAGAPTPRRTSTVVGGVDLDVVLWPPTRPGADGPAPLVVQVHPGPTGAVDRSYAGVVHLLCARGFAVASVDTSGSTAHGRRHRERLLGRFGELDVHEVVATARHLVATGVAAPGLLFVRGTSAGGTTALCALESGTFAGAVAWYPASSFEDDDDGFEAGYLGALCGPDGASRAPLARAGALRGTVLLIQGADDRIVTPAETERLLEALAAAGVEARSVLVAGEGHGFRTLAGRTAALSAELDFYERTVAGLAAAARYDSTAPPRPPGSAGDTD